MAEKEQKERPKPGSLDAVLDGCTCPVSDNCRGAGIGCNGERHGWWISETCWMHREREHGS